VLDISSGTSYGGEDRPFASAEEIGVLKISAVTKGTFDSEEFKVVNRAQITKSLRFVKRGDFLFSRANTVELVAACCVVSKDYDRLFLPDKLWVLSLNEQLINSQFFNYLLKNERYRDVVRNLANGGHDSMLNISMKKFMTLGIPCPLIDLQGQFAAIVEKVESLKSTYQQSLTDLESLYGTLSQHAFKGELDLSRVSLPNEGYPSPVGEIDDALITPKQVVNHLVQAGQTQSRSELLSRWLQQYLSANTPDASLGSVQFMESAWQTLQNTQFEEGETPALTLDDYDALKGLIFSALDSGELTQSFDEGSHRIALQRASHPGANQA
jgi:type I restriction enzyme S subunit